MGDELNRFGVLCMGLPDIPAPGLIPDPSGRRVAGSRRVSPGLAESLARRVVFVRWPLAADIKSAIILSQRQRS